eukprot:NODE_1117_length_1572_cov_50.078792_g920_i0.p1 GENE.NODE_1117_length_1572_cov_50.078792_g920_i0~~NODE_1117_length_1572_cov_50.078792_g920_i0.p1  ORF type:complete len:491 (-),score=150.92 NODE_1117_length_1572_cov_50.078792_g920_i0:98-1453(-)
MEVETGIDKLLEQQQLGNADLERRVSELKRLQTSIDSLSKGGVTPYDRLPYPHEIPLSSTTYSNAELNIMAMQASMEDCHRSQIFAEQIRVVEREVKAADLEVGRLTAVLEHAQHSEEAKDAKMELLQQQLQHESDRFQASLAEKAEALAQQQQEHENDLTRFNETCEQLMKQIDLQRAELLAEEMSCKQLHEDRDLQRQQNARQAELIYDLEAEDLTDKIALKRQHDIAAQLEVDRAIESENNRVKQIHLADAQEHFDENSKRFEASLNDLEKRVDSMDIERAREKWIHELKLGELERLVSQSHTQQHTFRQQATDASRAIDALKMAVHEEKLLSDKLEQQRDIERSERDRIAHEATSRLTATESKIVQLQQQQALAQALLERQRMEVQKAAVEDAVNAQSLSAAVQDARTRFSPSLPLPSGFPPGFPPPPPPHPHFHPGFPPPGMPPFA